MIFAALHTLSHLYLGKCRHQGYRGRAALARQRFGVHCSGDVQGAADESSCQSPSCNKTETRYREEAENKRGNPATCGTGAETGRDCLRAYLLLRTGQMAFSVLTNSKEVGESKCKGRLI